MVCWYENRRLLKHGQVFSIYDGTQVRLSSRVPGDGTRWYADILLDGRWISEDFTVEPCDLVTKLSDGE